MSDAASCIVCKGVHVRKFLDLGQMPLANKFLTKAELEQNNEAIYPLVIGFCSDCGHVQLIERVPPSAMFDHYLYISSMSDTLRAHLHDLATKIVQRLSLTDDDLVVDIGSNDVTLLEGFRHHGMKTLGIDPAMNLSGLSKAKGIETVTAYFSEKTARAVRTSHGPAKLIISTNTFPHIPALEDFISGIDILMAPHGTMIIEAHYLLDLLQQNAFDTIYHEHVSYWALGPMRRLFHRFGMEIVSVERLPIHHGQIRAIIKRKGSQKPDSSVEEILAEERRTGLDRFETYQIFARKAYRLRDSLLSLLSSLKARGKTIAGYGAPAKSSTLITFMQLNPDVLAYLVDRSPLKQGRYTPGGHIPISDPGRLLIDQPDYVVMLAWNFADEILRQQLEYRRRGGKFILPVPEVKIV